MSKHTRPSVVSSENNRRIFEFLQSEPVGVLATTNQDGSPQAAVIYFSVDEDFVITFTTKSETKKYTNLQNNNQVIKMDPSLITMAVFARPDQGATRCTKPLHSKLRCLAFFLTPRG